MQDSDQSHDDKLSLLLEAADATVKSYCHRDFELQNYIGEVPFKGGTPDLPLLQRPVRPVGLQGNLTQGSTTITGLTTLPALAFYSTSQLVVGQPVAVTGATATATLRTAIPPFTTITAVNTNAGTATMSQAALASGTVPLIFGLDVYVDFGGNYGWGRSAFLNGPNNSTRLYAGLDYAPEIDSPDGSSKCGLLVLLGQSGFGGGLWALAPMGWGFGGVGGYGPYGGPLTQAMPPTWPTYPGAIRVDYTAGLGVGANAANNYVLPDDTTIPDDLTNAVVTLAIYEFQYISTGMIQVQSTTFQGYTQRLMRQNMRSALSIAPELGDTRDVLSRYIEIPT